MEGFVYLRNQEDYSRSLYREFTRRWGNPFPFSRFVQENREMLNLVEVVAGLQEIFDGRLACARFDKDQDVCSDFFRRYGLSCSDGKKENRNPGIGVLETEAIRIANQAGCGFAKGYPGVPALLESVKIVIDDTTFIERGDSEKVAPSPRTVARFTKVSGLSNEEAEQILAPQASKGLDIALLTPLLEELLRPWLVPKPRMKAPPRKKRKINSPRKLYWWLKERFERNDPMDL